jgi:hypothetical protein
MNNEKRTIENHYRRTHFPQLCQYLAHQAIERGIPYNDLERLIGEEMERLEATKQKGNR